MNASPSRCATFCFWTEATEGLFQIKNILKIFLSNNTQSVPIFFFCINMQTLPSECVAHIISFLNTKDALCFAETASLYNEIIVNNKDRVREYVVERKTDNSETLLSANIFGKINFSETTKEIGVKREIFKGDMPCIITTTSKGMFLKKEKHGVWEDTTDKNSGKRTRSLWVKGQLIYIHTLCDNCEYFANPADKPGKDTFSWNGHSLRVSFWRRYDYHFRSCNGEQHPSFYESAECSPFSLCCSKHQGELPAPLF
ncbi:hypothetical protein [Kurlavirus BKC-1]|nr:hypothetical protein [Kurlavirus BKC-1]